MDGFVNNRRGLDISASSDVSLVIGKNFTGTATDATGYLTAQIGGNFTGVLSGSSVSVNIGGSVLGASTIASHQDLSVEVGGSVAPTAKFVAGDDLQGFHVGGAFNGRLTVANDVLVGTAGSGSTLVTGAVGSAAIINIGGDFGPGEADSYAFGGAFLGRLTVGGQLLADLSIGGAARSLHFGGGVGPTTAGDLLADITIAGNLTALTSGSAFTLLTPNTGTFEDSSAVITGNLAVGGTIGKVFPLA